MAAQAGAALRQVFGETVAQLADDDPRIVMLDGDVGSSTGAALFEAAYPGRYLQCGIAEQNMLGMAAGLATVGFLPFVSTFACFAVARALDSIRVLIAQPGLNVKIIGGYSGLLTGMTGKTHQIFNDVAIMRSLPGMTVVAPADEVECRQSIRAIAAADGPAYLQVSREPSPVVFGPDYAFRLGQAVPVRRGSDATLVSTGVQTARAAEAAEILAARGIDVSVLHVPTIKPLDEDALVAAASSTGYVITVEEQSVLGGLGGAVAEVLADRYPVPVRRLGIADCFGESGPDEQLLDKYRLAAPRVADDVAALLRERPGRGGNAAAGNGARPPRHATTRGTPAAPATHVKLGKGGASSDS